MRQVDLTDAYKALGLSQTASLEEVKNSYKKLALQYHPDKNPSPDATERFQEISAAYSRITRSIESPGEDEGHYWDENGGFGEEMDMEFFLFLFSRMFRAQGGGEGPAHRHPFAERGGFERNETEAEYARALAAYLAERKRALEAAQREAQKKEMERRKQQQREEEARLVAERKEQRRRKKDRRAKAQQEQKETAKEMRRASQRKRSEIFRMARSGDAEGVQRGIWEQNVDAAGQECLVGMEDDPAFLDSRGDADYGLKETFLHIFARRGDLDMVKWLVDHNAEAEERDSRNRTPFHVALQHGHISILSYFIETFPPQMEESMPFLEPPRNVSNPSQEYSLLRLAIDSLSLPAVRFIISNRLFDQKELAEAWNFVSGEGWAGPGKGHGGERQDHADISNDEKRKRAWTSIRDFLKQEGHFEEPMPPAPPTLPMQVESSSITTTELLQVGEQVHSPLSTVEQPLSRKNKPRKSKKKPKNNVDTHRTSAPLVQHSATSEVNTGAPLFDKNPHLIPANTPDSAGPFPENKSKFDNEKVFTEADLRPRSAATENANSSPTTVTPPPSVPLTSMKLDDGLPDAEVAPLSSSATRFERSENTRPSPVQMQEADSIRLRSHHRPPEVEGQREPQTETAAAEGVPFPLRRDHPRRLSSQAPLIPPKALLLLVPVMVMVFLKVIGGGWSSGGKKRAMDKALIRQMMAMAQSKRGREEGGMENKVDALLRVVQATDPSAALVMQRAMVTMDSAGIEIGGEGSNEVEAVRQEAVAEPTS